MIDRTTPLTEAFGRVDDVLHQAIQGISDLILMPGLINLDFADVTTIMSGMGLAIMGTGVGHGDDRAVEAANQAVSSPLLEDASVKGARGVVVNVTGGSDLSLMEVSEATSIIQKVAHEEANIIFGAVVDPSMEGQVKVTVIATGFGDEAGVRKYQQAAQTPVDLQSYETWRQPSQKRPVTSVSLARRPVLALPGPPPRQPASKILSGEVSAADGTMEVPAFLRRQAE